MDNLYEAYLDVYSDIDEATAMAKRGYDEAPIRQKIAANTQGGAAADRARALANKPTYGQKGKGAPDPKARQNLARAQSSTHRQTTSSNPGLHGYAHKSDDPTVKAKQAARGAQRGSATLTPNERKQLNMGDESFDLFDFILEYLVSEGYANTNDNAIAIMANMSEDWKESILDEAYVDYRKGKLSTGRSPKETADRKYAQLQARAAKEEGENPDTTSSARSRARKSGPVRREMDAHTGIGGKINKALSPGLGNRPGASPRMAHGEPNTQRHQMARFRRTGKEYGEN